MTGPEYDAELEAFLKRRSPMHRRLSDIDHAEPSLEVDRLVLNRAREALDTPSQPLFRSSRWALPMGLAATILIAFTVVLNVDRHGSNAAKPLASTVSPAAEAHAPAVARAAQVKEQARTDQPQLLSDSAERGQRNVRAEKKAEAPAALAKRGEGRESRDASSGSADSARLLASNSAVGSSLSTREPPVIPLGASAAPGVMPSLRAPAAAAAANEAAPAAPPPGNAADPHSSPDSWLREIHRLRAAGRIADADRELVAFREAYPTHPAYSVAKPPTR